MKRSIGGWNKRPVAPGMKWCPMCAAERPVEMFSRHGAGKMEAYCKPHKAARNKEIVERNRHLPDLTAHARFWPKVNKDGPNGCWVWAASCGKDGYGRFVYRGVVINAHRAAMILSGAVVPDGMDVDHFCCKERRCVNPAHLRVVTETVNALENNESPLAKNKRKTHCKYGHPLSGDNIRITHSKGPNGSPTTNRLCLACYGPGGIRKVKRLRELSDQQFNRTEGP